MAGWVAEHDGARAVEWWKEQTSRWLVAVGVAKIACFVQVETNRQQAIAREEWGSDGEPDRSAAGWCVCRLAGSVVLQNEERK